MATKKKCGTMPAVRRHERRGEDLDAECRQARSDYNAAQYQRRKELAEEAPAVVAVLPADLPVPPGPWEGWEIPTNQIGLQPAANVWSRVDGAPEGSIPVERVTTWTWGARMGLDPVGQVVQDWHDNAPGVGDRLNTLAPHERAEALHRLGHGTFAITGGGRTRWTTGTRPHPDPIEHVDRPGDPDADTPDAPAWPWPLGEPERTVHEVWVSGDALLHDGQWFDLQPGRIVRAPTGTPIPDGWEQPPASDRLGAGLLTRAPWRVRSADQAISEWSWARSSPLTVIVVSPRPENRWEAYRGYGGMAESVGQFGGRDEAIEAARTLIDQDRNEVEWTGTLPPVQIIEAASPGYAAIENARTRRVNTGTVRG